MTRSRFRPLYRPLKAWPLGRIFTSLLLDFRPLPPRTPTRVHYIHVLMATRSRIRLAVGLTHYRYTARAVADRGS